MTYLIKHKFIFHARRQLLFSLLDFMWDTAIQYNIVTSLVGKFSFGTAICLICARYFSDALSYVINALSLLRYQDEERG